MIQSSLSGRTALTTKSVILAICTRLNLSHKHMEAKRQNTNLITWEQHDSCSEWWWKHFEDRLIIASWTLWKVTMCRWHRIHQNVSKTPYIGSDTHVFFLYILVIIQQKPLTHDIWIEGYLSAQCCFGNRETMGSNPGQDRLTFKYDPLTLILARNKNKLHHGVSHDNSVG